MPIICGWDVSTSAIGVAVCDGDNPPSFHVIFPKGETHLQKHQDAAEKVALLCEVEGLDGSTHVVEQCLGGFTGGFSSVQTRMALCAMNAVVSYVLSLRGSVMHMLPVTTKAIAKLKKLEGEDKKDAVVRWARAQEPSFPYEETKAGNWVKGTDDMADALLLAYSGGKVVRGEAHLPSGRKGKARGRKQAPGPAAASGEG